MADGPNPYETPSASLPPPPKHLDFSDPRLRSAGWGLRLILVAGILVPACWIVVLPLGMFISSNDVQVLLRGLWLIAAVLAGVGLILCATVPRETGARPLIAFAIGTQWIGSAIAASRLLTDTSMTVVYDLFLWTGVVAGFVSFLIRLAQSVGRDDVARRGFFVEIIMLAMVVGAVILHFARPTVSADSVMTMVIPVFVVLVMLTFCHTLLSIMAMVASLRGIGRGNKATTE